MNFTKPISKLLDEVKKAFIQDQIDKGIKSSGASAKSIKKESKETSGTLTGDAYFYQQRHGRKPGRFPPISAIISWIQTKGIQPTDISEKSLAFLIARKISKQGTDIYTGKRPALDPDEKVQTLVAEFSRQIGKALKQDTINSFK